MTTQFELTLLTAEVTNEQEDLIYDEYDALIASHTGATRLTVTVEGATVLDGAHRLLGFLRTIGVAPKQFSEDFVIRADVASGQTSAGRPSVCGSAASAASLPQVSSPVAGGIWLFGEIDAWLRTNVPTYDAPDVAFPTRDDHVALGELLLRFHGRSAFRLDLSRTDAVTVADSTVEHSRGPIDRHVHGWSQVAQVRSVDLTLAA